MVVFRGHENVSIERRNFFTRRFGVSLAVLMHRRWHGLIQKRQFIVFYVYDLKLRILARLQETVHPCCNRGRFPPWPCAADDDADV